MEIVVCGDSFCSASKWNRNHFSQILQDKFGYSVINLARGGASSINIAYQIKTAIDINPDIIIYSRTKFPRFDLKLTDKSFVPGLGLKNFVYSNPDEVSSQSSFVGDKNAAIFSNNFGSLLPTPIYKENLFVNLSNEKKFAVEQYCLFLHDENLTAELDKWIYEFWEFKISQKNIPYIAFNDFGKDAYEFYKTNPKYPEIYHTDPETQEVVAKKAYDIIVKITSNG